MWKVFHIIYSNPVLPPTHKAEHRSRILLLNSFCVFVHALDFVSTCAQTTTVQSDVASTEMLCNYLTSMYEGHVVTHFLNIISLGKLFMVLWETFTLWAVTATETEGEESCHRGDRVNLQYTMVRWTCLQRFLTNRIAQVLVIFN